MKVKMCSLYDSKVKAYMQPFASRSLGEAERGLVDLVNNPETAVGKYPEDFILYQIGEFDDETGRITDISPPILIGRGDAYRRDPMIASQPKATELRVQ